MALKIHKPGIEIYDATTARLPQLLQELLSAPASRVSAHSQIPEAAGIYLFSEKKKAIYVGQTRKLRRRLKNHTRLQGKNNQATFAFLVAKSEAEAAGIDTKQYREALEADKQFAAHFDAAKARVADMDVRYILLKGPIERTLFEVYAALTLDTLVFNSFETH